jgi:drug/metabolite transporter (DMT)-like permease
MAGVAVLLAGIFGLAQYNMMFLQTGRDTLGMAIVVAIATGIFVALYTTYDDYGIRVSTDPFTFIAWFFFDGLLLPPFIFWRWLRTPDPPSLKLLMVRGCIGAVVAYMSFGSVMLATLLGKVGEAAVLRETSTIFAALIGWLVLKETVGPWSIALMALIAIGAVIVEIGG